MTSKCAGETNAIHTHGMGFSKSHLDFVAYRLCGERTYWSFPHIGEAHNDIIDS